MNGREIPVKIKPILRITEEEIPDLGDVGVGDKVSLLISGKVKSISQEEIEKNKEVKEYVFEIQSANVQSGLKRTDFGEALEGRQVK